jgi:hypothetical protein
MLVYYIVEVDAPFAEAEKALLKQLAALSGSARLAYREGERLGAKVGLAAPFAKTVRIDVGEPIRSEDHTIVPLTREATGPTGLFPKMEADLLLAPLGVDYSHLSFRGSYDPPFGLLGEAIDRILHRVAEGTVRRFTDRLAASLAGEARASAVNS